ncbi:Hexokinase-1 [Penicillium digitatum]|uniref:Phosphotransferase n=3 Tax=Penicillium digitatum TaxID=36651 RepID=K9GAQ5_PEND2|nr:Hexokinase-1 [Penicillium digitatum Pd1]EKV05518.1 Hexokinase-1 [Penicillium digitatum Pd1]EKV18174.1 Hexokinase-1 [Penicillium digitatum PHI26]QQK40350.1 Hexokinase-1 [Penicillium digitatum]
MSAPLVKVLHRLRELFHNVLATLESMILFPSFFRGLSRRRQKTFLGAHGKRRSLDHFAEEVETLCSTPLSTRNMVEMSEKIRAQFRECLQTSPFCMLPSYNTTLPAGTEKGTYLALDVGGSTFRVALIELNGRHEEVRILKVSSVHIDEQLKMLEGTQFFDWMAGQIETILKEVGADYGRGDVPLGMGLSWSFPIEQISHNRGLVIHMGKGFKASVGTVGQELGDLLIQSCRKRNLNVEVAAIVNDSSAALLSRAYVDPKTRMSLILGTGTNMAIHFPVHEIGTSKFGVRPEGWFGHAKHVLINTEMSMFGGGVLPTTRWDDMLNRTHLRPNYQPLEYMITGRYLGEIVRLIIVEATETARMFGGELPHSMREPYSFDTSIVACLEEDSSPSLSTSAALLQKLHAFHNQPSVDDLRFLRRISQTVSRRAAGYLATAIHSMWCLRNEAEFPTPPSTVDSFDKESPEITIVEHGDSDKSLSIACDGAVINKYPGFRAACQSYLDQLTEETSPGAGCSIRLNPAPESAILGAAVAVAISVA